MGGSAHLKVVIIASVAGVLFGFDTAVIAGVTHALRETFALTRRSWGNRLERAMGHSARRARARASGRSVR